MKIIRDQIDKKQLSGSIEAFPESQDDIYELSSIIQKNDIIGCFTHRKIIMDSKNSQKIGLFIKVICETTSTDLENGIIYCKGKICNENEHVKKGVYHTLEIELGKKFILEKEKWSRGVLKTFKEMTKPVQNIMAVIFFEKDCVISLVGKNRIDIKLKQEIKNKKYIPIFKYILSKVEGCEVVVFGMLIDIENDLIKSIRGNKDLYKFYSKFCFLKIPQDLKKSTNAKVINYVLTNESLSNKLNCITYVNDIKEVERFFTEFSKGNELLCIGFKEISEANESYALEKVFIVDSLYKSNKFEERVKIDSFCDQLECHKVKIFVVPISHYCGTKLEEMGGISGILKFHYK